LNLFLSGTDHVTGWFWCLDTFRAVPAKLRYDTYADFSLLASGSEVAVLLLHHKSYCLRSFALLSLVLPNGKKGYIWIVGSRQSRAAWRRLSVLVFHPVQASKARIHGDK
jgi:hypothetical protein